MKNLAFSVDKLLSIYNLFPPHNINILAGGLQKILSLLEAEATDARINAVKIVANLSSEGFSVDTLR